MLDWNKDGPRKIESIARHRRYPALMEEGRRQGTGIIMVAHCQDDQIGVCVCVCVCLLTASCLLISLSLSLFLSLSFSLSPSLPPSLPPPPPGTVVYRMSKSSGIDGLGGMSPLSSWANFSDVSIARPLLDCSKVNFFVDFLFCCCSMLLCYFVVVVFCVLLLCCWYCYFILLRLVHNMTQGLALCCVA